MSEPESRDDPPDIGYAAAMAELEDILEQLEDADLDVDLLADRVQRASALISVCRGRITRARLQVEQVVASLEPAEESSLPAATGADDPEPAAEPPVDGASA